MRFPANRSEVVVAFAVLLLFPLIALNAADGESIASSRKRLGRLPGTPTAHSRPMAFWQVDALQLAERLRIAAD